VKKRKKKIFSLEKCSSDAKWERPDNKESRKEPFFLRGKREGRNKPEKGGGVEVKERA